jgi:hypothetical protein
MPAKIKYNEEVIASAEPGQVVTVKTEGSVMPSDIIVDLSAIAGGSYEEGKKAEYDAFWDAYQDSGDRANYNSAFAGLGWNDETFKPKYDIKPTNVGTIFSSCAITDVVKALKDCGVVLDISKANITDYFMHANDYTTTLPTLDCRGSTDINFFLAFNSALRFVEKVILKADGSQTFNDYSFGWLYILEEIRFEGCIGKNFSIKDSYKLSTASVQSIIDCLKDLTGATSQTLTLHTTVGGNMTPEQKATITAKNWTLVY